MLATVANDYHFLPTAMLRDLLHSRGFDVIDLGANTPPSSLASMCHTVDDLVGIGIAATTPGAEKAVAESISAVRSVLPLTPIVVGGSAFANVDDVAALGDCIPSSSAREAIEIFDRLHQDRRAG